MNMVKANATEGGLMVRVVWMKNKTLSSQILTKLPTSLSRAHLWI